MIWTDNLKIVRWFKACKELVANDPDLPIVLNDSEFVFWANQKMHKNSQVSLAYIMSIISYNPNAKSALPPETEAKFGDDFRAWWKFVRMEQELTIYKKMLAKGEPQWQRYDNVLAKRFGKKWHKQELIKMDADVKVTSTLGDKLREISKNKVDNE
jgi:hypothetical protein